MYLGLIPRNMEASVVELKAGYVIRTLVERDMCDDCIQKLERRSPPGTSCLLIQFQGTCHL